VYNNMAFGLKLRKYPKAEIKKRVQEAAELLGCSARTIRRRFEDGTFATKIEYQGKQMIRLVSREDVMKAAGKVQVSEIAGSPSDQGIKALSVTLGALTDNIKETIDRRIDTIGRRLAIYGIITAALTAAAIVIFVNRQNRMLSDKIGGIEAVVSGGISELKADLGGDISRLRTDSTAKIDSLKTGLTEELKRIEENRTAAFTDIRRKAERAAEEARDAGAELILTRMKTADNKSRVSDLEKKIKELQAELDSLQINLNQIKISVPAPGNGTGGETSKKETGEGKSSAPAAINKLKRERKPGTETATEVPGLDAILYHYRPKRQQGPFFETD